MPQRTTFFSSLGTRRHCRPKADLPWLYLGERCGPPLARESLVAVVLLKIAVMLKMIVASSSSCKTQILPPLSASKPKQPPSLPQATLSFPKLRLPKPLSSVSLLAAAAEPFALLVQPLPTLVAEIEKATLFNFNLTLPIIMGEFHLLMFVFNKINFYPKAPSSPTPPICPFNRPSYGSSSLTALAWLAPA